MNRKTEQEEFWSGEFGDEYVDRNKSDALLTSKICMFSTMLRSTNKLSSVRELGCNIGLNLVALNKLKPSFELSGYEINKKAADKAASLNIADIFNTSILEDISGTPVDLTFTCGVLIHIDPDHLDKVYQNLVNSSKRYVLVAEYYNPSPVSISYRGHQNKLFKRDFAGELIDKYGLKLVDYGFFYHRDELTPQDDISWFLLEK